MAEYIITEDEYHAVMRKAYEAGAAGRDAYTVRDYMTRPVVRCRDCVHYEPETTWEEFREQGLYETCGEPPTCTLGYALSHVARYTHPDGYCAWGERDDDRCR